MALHRIRYSDAATRLSGALIVDQSLSGPRPGVMIVHGGSGVDAHAIAQTRRCADAGYVAFACDMYGEDVAGNRERILAEVQALKHDRARVAARANAGLDVLRGRPEVDGRLAVVGYCLGGLVALEMARTGIELAAVVAVHGTLTTTQPVDGVPIRTPILACQGALDPHCPIEAATTFAKEMKTLGADWELVVYGNAMHGFTHEDAKGQMPGVLYDADADARSLSAILAFLARAFER